MLFAHRVHRNGPVPPGNNRKPRKTAPHLSKFITLFALKYTPSHSPE